MPARRQACLHSGCFRLLLAVSGCAGDGKSQTCDSVETCQPLLDDGYRFVRCCTVSECAIIIEGGDETPHPSDDEVLCDELDCTNALYDLRQEYCGASI